MTKSSVRLNRQIIKIGTSGAYLIIGITFFILGFASAIPLIQVIFSFVGILGVYIHVWLQEQHSIAPEIEEKHMKPSKRNTR